MTVPEFRQSYADNATVTMAARLRAEIVHRGSNRLDVASGYLTISVWQVVGEALERLESFRLLLGKDWEMRVASTADEAADIAYLVREALRRETEPPRLPEPDDAEAIARLIRFLEQENVQVRAWRGDGFLHAKAYILNSSAGVGSANFTGAGFTTNRELVMWRQDDTVVAELRAWFERFWSSPDSDDYKADLINALRGTRFGGTPYTPYQLLIRTLADRYGLETPPSLALATFNLKWFQTDAVYRLVKLISGPARGALLADAVGLGKTFMALGVIHHALLGQRRSTRGRPVLLIIPASLRRMWIDVLDRYNLAWAVDILHVQELREDFDFSDYLGADLVVIDEAHRLRGGRVWFRKVLEILQRSIADPRVLLLTATPVNTSIRDLTNLLRVLSKNRRNIWAPEIPDFERYLKRVEQGDVDPYPLLDRSVVRRSRSDVVRAYEERKAVETGLEPITLPTRRLAHEPYEYVQGGGGGLFATFEDVVTHLYLAPYDLERFRRPSPGVSVDLETEVPASPLAGLYLTGLLKRFESSVRALAISLRRLDRVLELFQQAVRADPPRLLALGENRELRRLIEDEVRYDEDDVVSIDESRLDNLIQASPTLSDPESYDLDAVAKAVRSDREAIAHLQTELPAEDHDGKFKTLLDALTRPMAGQRIGLRDRRVLIFTQFRDTAIYIAERLQSAAETHGDVGAVALLHGGSSATQRDRVARTFDPDAPGELEAAAEGLPFPRVLVSTDVLAEGHNLQRAEAVINYDVHWNPQVIVQRAGRIDRLNSPHETVYLVSFLPEDDLEHLLGLVDRLNDRFGLYQRLGLADEPVTRLPADQVIGMSLEQLRRLYRDDPDVLDDIERAWTFGSTDYMRAPLESFLRGHAAEAIRDIPQGVQSVKRLPADWRHGPGVFIAFQHGEGEEALAYWRFYPRTEEGFDSPLRDEVEMFRAITCTPAEPRASALGERGTPSSGGVIDWDLLRRAAKEVAEELTAARHTAQITRGASERSARLRARLLGILNDSEPAPQVGELLDRLEQVRVEDYDADPGYEVLMERLRSAERTEEPARRAELTTDIAEIGIELLGPYEEDKSEAFEAVVRPEELRLTSWETLVEREAPEAPAWTEQLTLEGSEHQAKFSESEV